jgi:hypothetical protein
VTDRNSFAERKGSSRSKATNGTAASDATPIALGRHEAMSEHASGAHGDEQSERDELPSPSRRSGACMGMPGIPGLPGMPRVSDADARAAPVESQAEPLLTTDKVRSMP